VYHANKLYQQTLKRYILSSERCLIGIQLNKNYSGCLDMIDRQTAEQIADDFINSPRWNRTGDRFVILSRRTIEKEYGWVFFYDSEDLLRNGYNRPPLMGAAPVLVTKADGSVQPLGTAFPIEIILAEYEAMRSLPPRRPQASVVYLLNQADVLDMHTSLDMQ